MMIARMIATTAIAAIASVALAGPDIDEATSTQQDAGGVPKTAKVAKGTTTASVTRATGTTSTASPLVGGDIGKGECRFWKLAANTTAESKTAAESNSADGKSAANAESQAGAKANDAQGGAKPNTKAKDSAPPAPPAPQSVPLDTSVAIATAGPCTAMAVHPEGRRFLLAQTMGKGSYPDSGRLDSSWLPLG